MKQVDKKITPYEFYFALSLYDFVSLESIEGNIFSGDIDAINKIDNLGDTTYSIDTTRLGAYNMDNGHVYYKITLECKRSDTSTPLVYFILKIGDIVAKVGQYPSLADLTYATIEKEFENEIGKKNLFFYKKAIGLYAHSVGIGSIVYLRRIFEDLIKESYSIYVEKNKDSDSLISELTFRDLSMIEKVEFLKDYLPSKLQEMKKIYSILSLSIHELEEEDCLKYFPVLKLSIDLILKEKIAYKKKEREETEIFKSFMSLTKELS